MIQTQVLALSKDMARIPLGPNGAQSYLYWADLRRQWESANNGAKMLELIGGQSVARTAVPEVVRWLGGLTETERDFMREMTVAYQGIARLASSVPVPVDPAPDIYETILDNRLLADHVRFPCRVLDIGPGAGRHLLNLFLHPAHGGSSYVGVESVGLPYTLQNLAASFIAVLSGGAPFADGLDYEFARQPFRIPVRPALRSIYHLPLWQADAVPSGAFDLILCNYLLDEVSADDFHRIVRLIGRALAPEGVIYCRGSQERAMLKDMYLYGMGTFHQQDITASLLAQRLRVKECALVASTLTRLFVREDARSHGAAGTGYATLRDDQSLVEQAQRDFIRQNIEELKARRLRVAIWGEEGWADFLGHIAPHAEGLRVVGFTTDHARQRYRTSFGAEVVPASELVSAAPEAVIIASNRDQHILRQIRELFPAAGFTDMRRLTHPVAFAYTDLPLSAPGQCRTGAAAVRSRNSIPASVADRKRAEDQSRSCLVSALVTTYKAERFMRGLLEDLEAQTMADRLEIVIVDSASPGNEHAIVEEFQRHHDNIVYVRTEARENSHVALNRALRMARGKYVTLANADDRHRPDAFERMLAALEARPEVALVYADSAITDQENATLDAARILGYLRLPEFERRGLFRGCGIGPQPMWRKDLHARYGYFDPEFEICGDYEFWLRMGVQETFLHLPEILGLYFMSPTSNERVNRIRRHQETERARRKHWPTAWGELPPWDADFNEMLECPRIGEPVTVGSHASRTTRGSTPASTPGEESDMAAGHLALERQDWPQTCAAFIRVLERDRKCAAARSGLGLGLLALGDAEEGLAQLQEAVRLEPSPDIVSNLACGLIHVGRHAEACQLLEGILAVVPDHAAARANLDLLRAAGNTGDHRTVCEPAPDAGRREDLASLLETAAQQLAGKRWTAAVDGFRRVLEMAPDLAEARAALGSALLVLGRIEEAIVELAQAAERLNTSETWNNLGWAEAAACHPEAARAALIKAIECDPENLEPQRNLAALFETLEMPGEAERAYDLILLSAPDDREALAGRARTRAAVASRQDPAGISRRGVGSQDTVLVHG